MELGIYIFAGLGVLCLAGLISRLFEEEEENEEEEEE